jgi:hypothetical protein
MLQYNMLISILLLPHTYLSLSIEMCDSPDHAAHYHILGVQIMDFDFDPAPGLLQNVEVILFKES